MFHMVLPPAEAPWSISAEELKRALEHAFPGASVQLVREPIHSVVYELPMPHSRLSGRMRNTGQVFTFEGDFADCAAFAVWLRTLIPPQHPLVFCDEGYTHDIALRPETTSGDILRAFGTG